MKKLVLLFVFVIIQIGLFAQCVVICNVNINYSLDSNGQGILYPDIVDGGSYDSCNLELALYDETNTIELIPYGDTIALDCDHLGDLIYRMRDEGTQNVCWGGIGIQDVLNVCTSSTKEISPELKTSFSNGILEVKLPEGITTELHVYNLIGKLMFTKKMDQYNSKVDLTVLDQKGIYIVSAMIDKKIRSKKIVVW